MGKLRVAVSGSAAALLLSLSMMGSTPVRAQAVAIEEEPAPAIEAVEDEQSELIQSEDDVPEGDGFVLSVADDGSGGDGGDTGEKDPSDPPPATSIANGTCGSCSWVIDLDHGLTITPTDGVAGTLQYDDALEFGWPWGDFAADITSVSIAEGVSVGPEASGLFAFYSSLTTLDVSHLDVSGVTDMTGMFQGCSSLRELDLSAWNVGSVASTKSMFQGCSSLESLNATGLVTSSTQNISNMFSECSSLSNLVIAEWDTSAVTNMAGMFQGCSSLESLDLSTWNVGSVESTRSMFQGCSSLKSLNVTGLVTSSTQNISNMFSECSSLSNLVIAEWDTSAVTDMKATFQGCSRLRSVGLSGWDTSQVTSMNAMFKDCGKLQSIGLERWNMGLVDDMDSMFYGCKSLTSLDLSHWDTSPAFSMSSLFYNCSALESLDLSNMNMRYVTSVADMFEQCVNLAKVTVGKDFSLRTDLGEGNSLPTYHQWRSAKTGQVFDGAEIPEYEADTYVLNKGKMTAVITLNVQKPSLNVPLVSGKACATPINVTVSEGPYEGYLSDVTFSNVSSNPTARTFIVNSRTGAVSVPSGTAAGTYEVKLKAVAPENDSFQEASDTASFTLKVKYANPMVVSAKQASVAVAYNAAAATTLGANISVGNAKGKLTYTNASQNATAKKFVVDASTGAISVPKGTAIGTYEVVVKVNAAESEGNWAGQGAASFKIVVNKAASSIRLGDQTKTYTGKALAYTGTVTKSGSTGAVTYAYYRDASCTKAVKAADVKGAGVYYVKATVAASATHTAATSAAAKLTISKAANPMSVKVKAQTVKAKKLKSKAIVVAPLVVKSAQGKVTYAKASGSGNISINKKTGKVTVKKKTKKGTYKVKVKVTAAGNTNYKSSTKTVTVKVVVK